MAIVFVLSAYISAAALGIYRGDVTRVAQSAYVAVDEHAA